MKILLLLLLTACASKVPVTKDEFYLGSIQRGSLTGQNYGPPFESLVRRKFLKDQIEECVIQEGKAFTVRLNRVGDSLVYAVRDREGFSAGKLTYQDKTMKQWTYDIQVQRPHKGDITGTGSLNEKGEMHIHKVWKGQVVINETYKRIAEDDFLQKIDTLGCP